MTTSRQQLCPHSVTHLNQILAEVKLRKASALGEFYDATGKGVFSILSATGLSTFQAEKILFDVYTSLWEDPERLPASADPFCGVVIMVHRAAKKHQATRLSGVHLSIPAHFNLTWPLRKLVALLRFAALPP